MSYLPASYGKPWKFLSLENISGTWQQNSITDLLQTKWRKEIKKIGSLAIENRFLKDATSFCYFNQNYFDMSRYWFPATGWLRMPASIQSLPGWRVDWIVDWRWSNPSPVEESPNSNNCFYLCLFVDWLAWFLAITAEKIGLKRSNWCLFVADSPGLSGSNVKVT